jgi:hypothetical protein
MTIYKKNRRRKCSENVNRVDLNTPLELKNGGDLFALLLPFE